jgi:hypothetical protein
MRSADVLGVDHALNDPTTVQEHLVHQPGDIAAWTVPGLVDTRLGAARLFGRHISGFDALPIYRGVQGAGGSFVVDDHRSIAVVARNIGVHAMTLGSWVK